MRLIAGLNRREALRILSIDSTSERKSYIMQLTGRPLTPSLEEALAKLPLQPPGNEDWKTWYVSVREDLDSEKDPLAAFQAEVSENEGRSNYKQEEIREGIKRLLEFGFELKKGHSDKPLVPEAMRLYQVSRSTVQRILKEMRQDENAAAAEAPETQQLIGKKVSNFERSLDRFIAGLRENGADGLQEVKPILEEGERLMRKIRQFEERQKR